MQLSREIKKMKKSKVFKSIIYISMVFCVLYFFYEVIENIVFIEKLKKESEVTPEQKIESGIESGNLFLVKEAVDEGVDLYDGERGSSFLSYACTYASSEIAWYLLENTKREKYDQKMQDEIMSEAMCFMEQDFVQRLLSCGYEVNEQVLKNLYYKFHLIEKNSGRIDRFSNDQKLVQNIRYIKQERVLTDGEKAVGNQMLKDGCICYEAALELSDHKNRYHLFLNGEVDITKVKEEEKDELLKLVSAVGKKELCIELQKAGADITQRDALGCSMLMIACQYGNEEMIEYLLSQGLDSSLENNEGNDCLAEAVLYDQEGSVSYLLKHRKADVKKIETQNELFTSIVYWDNVEMLKILREYGYDLTRIHIYGSEFSIGKGERVLQYLKETMDPKKKEEIYRLAFWAVEAGNTDVLNHLLEEKVPLNKVTNQLKGMEEDTNMTLMDAAILNSNPKMVKYLQKHKITKRADRSIQPESKKIS